MPCHKDKFKKNIKQSGQALIFALTMLSVLLMTGSALLSLSMFNNTMVRYGYNRNQTLALAEGGIDYAIRQLNLNQGYSSTPSPVALGAGEFEVTVTGTGISREVISTGYIPNKNNYKSKRTVKVTLTVNTTGIGFNYGVQAGEGGITMANNAGINGNVYSNGPIQGANGVFITGTAAVANGSNPTASAEWASSYNTYIFGQDSTTTDVAQSFRASQSAVVNRVSLYLRRYGSNLPANPTIRIVNDDAGSPGSNQFATGSLYASTVTSFINWADVSMVSINPLVTDTTYWLIIDVPNASANEYWGWGIDSPGSYSLGMGKYSQEYNKKPWSLSNGDFNFRIWSGGVENYIKNVNVSEDARVHHFESGTLGRDFYGHSFTNGTIGRDARAKELTACSVSRDAWADINTCTTGGTKYPGVGVVAPDQAGFPISQANIDEWKADTVGNVHVGDYTPPGEVANLGPIKIEGNLQLTNGQTINMTGTIYVTGTITFANNNIVKLDPAYGETSGIILSDSRIIINNNVQFQGSGQPDTYILVLSTNNSLNPVSPAIDIQNNANSAIAYAPNGMIRLNNNMHVKEATAYKLYLSENAIVTYETGLQSTLFTSGPGGGWQIKPGTWREIKI